MINMILQGSSCAPNCTILEPFYTRFDKTCESYDCIRGCKSFAFGAFQGVLVETS